MIMSKVLYLVSVLMIFQGCATSDGPDEEVLETLDTASSCPFITTNNRNQTVISYVAAVNDSVSVMRYRVSENEGLSFGKMVEIRSSRNIRPHGENLPKIIFKPGREIIAVWGSENPAAENKYAGKVFYAQSFDDGKTWTPAMPLVKDPGSYDQRYFDVALLPDGEVGIIWLDNRESAGKKGSTIYFAKTGGETGFAQETVIAESICPCCRTELIVDKKGTIYAAFRDIISDSIRDMVLARSANLGKSFEPGKRISPDNWVIDGCPHTGPAMTENDGILHFTWFTGGEPAGVFYCNSADAQSFSTRDSVSRKYSAKHPQIIARRKNIVAIVWDESVQHGERYNSRIGYQQRDNNGKILSSRYISADSLLSQFPVIGVTAGRSIIVAFTQGTGKNSKVMYYRPGT
jgi:hypothetical protein